MLESLIFGMFVLAIMVDQLSAVFSDETAVEHVRIFCTLKIKIVRFETSGIGVVCLWFDS